MLDEQPALIRTGDGAHGAMGQRNYSLGVAVLVRNFDQNPILDYFDDRAAGALRPAARFDLELDNV